MTRAVLSGNRWIFTFFATGLLAVSCSLPNLESPECAEARSAAKAFYAFHFGNDMAFSALNLDHRAGFLTPEFYDSLRQIQTDGDVFTSGTADVPKAFRVGVCEEATGDFAKLQVLLFWRDDIRSEQRAIRVELAKRSGVWLIHKIIFDR